MEVVKAIPTIINFLSYFASGIYFFNNDWKHGLYWLGAGVVTTMATLL